MSLGFLVYCAVAVFLYFFVIFIIINLGQIFKSQKQTEIHTTDEILIRKNTPIKNTTNTITNTTETKATIPVPEYVPILVKLYDIQGTNKHTNRRKKILIYAQSEIEATKQASEQSILPPYEIKWIQNPPTEAQLNYAHDLGINIPEGATKEDVSHLIENKLDHDGPPNPGLLEYADKRSMISCRYIGKKRLYDTVFTQLKGLDKSAFFAFSLYRWLSDDRHANLDTHSQKHIFYEFAEIVKDDTSFMKSLRRYDGRDLRVWGKYTCNNRETLREGSSTNTIAYKKTANFLHEKFGTPLTRIVHFD